MTEKRFVYYEHKGADYILDTPNESLDFIEMLGDCLEAEEIVDLLNYLNDENEQLKHRIEELRKELSNCEEDYNMQDMEIKALRKELHLAHMSSMFSTVKSFKGDISKRYKYSEKTDMIYDTANHYGKYDKILDKKEVTMLLNEYNTLLEESNEE